MQCVHTGINTGLAPVFISLTPAIDFVQQYIEVGNRDEDAYILVSCFVLSMLCRDDTADRDYRALLKILVSREDAIAITTGLSRIIHGSVRMALPNWISIDPQQQFNPDHITISQSYLCITVPTYPDLQGVQRDSHPRHHTTIADTFIQAPPIIGSH